MMMTRRDFLGKMGVGAVVVAAGAMVAAVARFFEPNVTTPAPGSVEVGGPDEYPVGSLTYAEDAHAFLGRDQGGFYAIVAVCTHLGCIPRLEQDGFACPCHGSRFTREGQVLTGPAARPLDRAFVGRNSNGHLYIDRSRLVNANYRFT